MAEQDASNSLLRSLYRPDLDEKMRRLWKHAMKEFYKDEDDEVAEQDKTEAQVTDQFTGLNLNTGRTSVPFGAMVVQTNMTGNQQSEIASRPGLKPVEFDNE